MLRFLFEDSQPHILRVLPIPPREARPEQCSADVRSIGQHDIRHRAPMAILSEYSDRDFLAMDERRCELLGLLAEGLALLRTVDATQSDAFSLAIVEYIKGVAVENADDAAGEVGSYGRCHVEYEREEHDRPPSHSCVRDG